MFFIKRAGGKRDLAKTKMLDQMRSLPCQFVKYSDVDRDIQTSDLPKDVTESN